MEIYIWANYIHSILRWIILLLLIVAILKSLQNFNSTQLILKSNNKVSLFLLIAAHFTAVIGIYQWMVGAWGLKNIQNLGMSAVMKDSAARFWAVEHISMMLIAVILITVGRRAAKHKKAFWIYFIALLLILAAIPWPFREGIGRPWFPHI